jgi:hypothetical protein
VKSGKNKLDGPSPLLEMSYPGPGERKAAFIARVRREEGRRGEGKRTGERRREASRGERERESARVRRERVGAGCKKASAGGREGREGGNR